VKISQIQKLYIKQFPDWISFWYGIEKLFMGSIGIDAIGIGVATSVFLAFNLIFDIPAGILADKWSRKGVLAISALGLAICSVLLGLSHGLLLYTAGEVFYGVYIVCASGTYSAIIYDSLHEEGRASQYSKIAGRAYALFLAGAGVANIASGFIAHQYGYTAAFFITVISCTLNLLLILSIREPVFHKVGKKNES